MEIMEEIKRLWSEYESTPFPRNYIGEGELAELNIDLVVLDTFAGGAIDTPLVFLFSRSDSILSL